MSTWNNRRRLWVIAVMKKVPAVVVRGGVAMRNCSGWGFGGETKGKTDKGKINGKNKGNGKGKGKNKGNCKGKSNGKRREASLRQSGSAFGAAVFGRAEALPFRC